MHAAFQAGAGPWIELGTVVYRIPESISLRDLLAVEVWLMSKSVCFQLRLGFKSSLLLLER